jgi:glycosyltransferase involved in cell wall biosynthesis
MVRVAQISFHHDLTERRPAELLQAWPTVGQVARAARGGGAEVRVFQASRHVEQLDHQGIACSFGPLDARRLRAAVADADVLHVQGLGFAREVLGLAAVAEGRPLLLQDHADSPPRLWRRPLWRRSLAQARGLMFCALEQAEAFSQHRLIAPHTRVYEAPESTCDFRPRDREEARRATGIHGAPALLWVANLDANKDPLVVLEALAQAAPALPDLQLWCCYGRAPLEQAVRDRLQRLPQLAGRVHLLGRQAHERIEWLMAAADFLVQGSHREGSGYAVMEALACGLPPLVTDIPSFRAMLGVQANPAVWPVGRSSALTERLLSAWHQPRQALREAARARFEAALGPAALGRRLVSIYEDLLS